MQISGNLIEALPAILYAKIHSKPFNFEISNSKLQLDGKEMSVVSLFKEVIENHSFDAKIEQIITQLYSSAYFKLLLEKQSVIRSMLNMGLRETLLQTQTTTEIMNIGLNEYLMTILPIIESKSLDLTSSVFLWASLYLFYSVIMIPTIQSKFPVISSWYKEFQNEHHISDILNCYGLSTRCAGDSRENSVQIDLLPDPIVVGRMADESISLNLGYKKKIETRKVVAPAPVVPTPVALPKTTKCEESLTPEDPVNEEEKTTFALLDKLYISHHTERHVPCSDIETLLSVLDQTKAIATKNLLLKAKKALNAEDTGIWVVIAAAQTTIDMNQLTKTLGYKSGSLRFATEDILKDVCGVSRGHLSLIALLNDKEKKCQLIIDNILTKSPNISLHPLINTSSTIISQTGFQTLIHYFREDKFKVLDF